MTPSLYDPQNDKGREAVYCEKHHLTVFSFNYCPLCVIERQKERERKVEPKSEGKK